VSEVGRFARLARHNVTALNTFPCDLRRPKAVGEAINRLGWAQPGAAAVLAAALLLSAVYGVCACSTPAAPTL